MRHGHDEDLGRVAEYDNTSDGGRGPWGLAAVILVLGLFAFAAILGLALGGCIDRYFGAS